MYCFGKTSKDDYSGYICYIYRKDCGYIQPLIDGNELIVGIYLNIYEQNKMGILFNTINYWLLLINLLVLIYTLIFFIHNLIIIKIKDCYLNIGIKNLIPIRNNDYEMKEEKYYEIGIDDWKSIHEWKNPHTWSRFIMCGHKW